MGRTAGSAASEERSHAYPRVVRPEEREKQVDNGLKKSPEECIAGAATNLSDTDPQEVGSGCSAPVRRPQIGPGSLELL